MGAENATAVLPRIRKAIVVRLEAIRWCTGDAEPLHEGVPGQRDTLRRSMFMCLLRNHRSARIHMLVHAETRVTSMQKAGSKFV